LKQNSTSNETPPSFNETSFRSVITFPIECSSERIRIATNRSKDNCSSVGECSSQDSAAERSLAQIPERRAFWRDPARDPNGVKVI